jgi:transcriptional regulator NrdR family protein
MPRQQQDEHLFNDKNEQPRLKSLDQVAYVRFASVYKSFRDIDEFMDEMSKLVRSRPTE